MSPAIEGGCGLRAREITRTGRSVLPRSRISQVPTASQGHAAAFRAARRDTAPECAVYVSQEVQRLRHSILCIWGRCRTVLRGAIVYAAVLLSLFFCGPAIARANVNLDAECTPDVAGLETYSEPVRFCETPTPLSGCTSIRFLQVHENSLPPLHTYAGTCTLVRFLILRIWYKDVFSRHGFQEWTEREVRRARDMLRAEVAAEVEAAELAVKRMESQMVSQMVEGGGGREEPGDVHIGGANGEQSKRTQQGTVHLMLEVALGVCASEFVCFLLSLRVGWWLVGQ